ncbi:hypothetical protein BUALT_Bualt12G0040700 [Buddleja alternifolia]|uniref:DUF7036 domain-containing protein n=1 Tax=Buddleja alternifolia TaxID=168488 RepID=A0AAV6WMD7_9LAMI|nr:hypothetical protein BUALT_Bualt12G0040700 [Buddleja alternifolia]
MGKAEDEQTLPSTTLDAQGTTSGSRNSNGCCSSCSRLRKMVTFRCVVVLVLGVAVLLSAVFWLPFFHFGHHKDLDLDYAGYDIVASFKLKKPASFLQNYILQLEGDIFDEMSFSTTKVHIISLESAGSNITKVVFAVEADVTTQSLIKGSFVSLITRQTALALTDSLFGDPFSFEVLKFRGGITVSPDQKAFVMPSDQQILFNFTLNFSIDQMLSYFDELSSQLKTGLHLSQYENLYIRLTNLKGSTVAQPTTVQSQVVLAVGINPSKRLKQLAQTIRGSHTKNLGLNNTVFGRVKQVRLSSILQHSLGGDGSGPSPSPSPSPMPESPHHHHHHHRHHHHHHGASLAPSISPSPSRGAHGSVIGKRSHKVTPVPAPAPVKNKGAEPPGCHFGYNFPKYSQLPPSTPPVHAPYGAPSQPNGINSPTPVPSPVPAAASPLPNVAHAHSQPPLKDGYHARPVEVLPLVSPSPSPCEYVVLMSMFKAIDFFCPLYHLLQYMGSASVCSIHIAFIAAQKEKHRLGK